MAFNCFGPPVYPDIVVDLPSYGNMNLDGNLINIVEAAYAVFDQNKFDVTNGKWGTPEEQADAAQWRVLLSKNSRQNYLNSNLTEHDWLNSLRNFLKQKADWSAWKGTGKRFPHGNPTGVNYWGKKLFDPVHWRIYNDEWTGAGKSDWHGFYGGGSVDDPGRYNNDLSDLYNQLRSYYKTNNIDDIFTWNYNWKNQNAKADINIPPPDYPDLEGFGIAQFLEWLTGMDYGTLFAWEYGLVLIISLISIAWTDFYPFFVEVGLV